MATTTETRVKCWKCKRFVVSELPRLWSPTNTDRMVRVHYACWEKLHNAMVKARG